MRVAKRRSSWEKRPLRPRAGAARLSVEMLEAMAGIEPAMEVLQTPALPLGYVASLAGSHRGVGALGRGRLDAITRVACRP